MAPFCCVGEGWLLANDVCKVLDYEDPGQAVNQHVSGHDRLKRRVMFGGKHRMMWIINESGMDMIIHISDVAKINDLGYKVENFLLTREAAYLRDRGGTAYPLLREVGRDLAHAFTPCR